jgi:YgiT-type zinc finger domain-containing protein
MSGSAGPNFKRCPTCGSRKIKLVERDYATTAKGRQIIVPNVRRHECPVCGEVLLDYDAVKQIEMRRLPSAKSRQLARVT